ncbi:hypothetical protein ACFYY8_41940 [Streptosporangium sp. NPDC001559]|uniref:hypothetical protein n=1 Tax=Streptosporangium sp. NPDC001559 TaxID=3366187 RepID=UPI0036EF219C
MVKFAASMVFGLAVVTAAVVAVHQKYSSEPLWMVLGVFAPLVVPAAIAVTVGFVQERRERRRRLERAAEDPGEVLRRRVEAVNTAFTEAASLMDDLRRDLAAQQAAREELFAQAEEQQRLLAIDQEQAEKIRQILVGETQATIRAERRQQWLFFVLGFAASALASIPIGIWVNSIS